MGIIGHIRAMRDVYRLRKRVLTAEDQLAQSLAPPPARKPKGPQPAPLEPGPTESAAVEPTGGGGGATPSSPAIRRELATLLREQADLLEVSLLARMITMLPSPERLRADADRLEDPTAWEEETGPS